MAPVAEFGAYVRISQGAPCGHCGEPISPGFFEFILTEAFHGDVECWHWLCLRCASGTVKRWTHEGGLSYRPRGGDE